MSLALSALRSRANAIALRYNVLVAGFRNFPVNIENGTCRIENQKWQLIEFNKKYLLCEVSDPQLKTFEINLMTNKAIYEDTDTDEMYELFCYKKI